MTSTTIYRSSWPSVPVPQQSIFTHIFGNTEKQDRVAFIDATSGRKFTHRDVRDRALSLAHGLLHEVHKKGSGLQLRRGDTIMVLSQNHFLFPVLVFGAFGAGLPVTLASSNSSPNELLNQWKDTKPKYIISSSSLVHVALKALELAGIRPEDAAKRIVVFVDGVSAEPLPALPFISYEDITNKGMLREEEKFSGEEAEEAALICYSSGTGGMPKGVQTSHRGLVALVEMRSSMTPLQDKPRVTFNPAPFCHIYGVTSGLIIPMFEGIPAVLMEKFEIQEFFRTIQTYRVEHVFVVPPIALALLAHPLSSKYDLTSLRAILNSGSPLAAPVVMGLYKKFNTPKQKLSVIQAYGMTEVTAVFGMPPAEGFSNAGSAGRPVPNMEVRLVDDDGRDVPQSENSVGELWIRGPNMMKGYLNNEAATREAITPDGWLKTGDIARRDSKGFFHIVDRKKEVIKYKGYQVPPAELEDILVKHPEVADSCVVGVVIGGLELPRGYITLKKPTEDIVVQEKIALGVQEWIKGKVGHPKYLRGGVFVVPEIPRSPAGKILRRVLKERADKEILAAKSKL